MPVPISTSRFVAHRVDLLRLAESAREKVLAKLTQMESKLLTLIHDNASSNLLRAAETIIRQSRKVVQDAYYSAQSSLNDDMVGAIEYESSTLSSLLSLDSSALEIGEADRMAATTLILGHKLTEWTTKQILDTQMRIAAQIRLARANGTDVSSLVSKLIGNSTNQKSILDAGGEHVTFVRKDGGALNTSYMHASGLVHTTMQAAISKADAKVFSNNKSSLEGLQAIVTLDGSTSDLCRSRAGGAWDTNGSPIEGTPVKIPFPGWTPWHWKCRTFLMPLKSGQSVDPQVSFTDWFNDQSDETQKDVAGARRYQLLQSGTLKPDDLIDPSGNRLTLAQLKNKIAA